MIIQDLESATTLITKQFTANPNKSLSGAFKHIRRQLRFSSFGDYPILSTITRTLACLGIKKNKQQILYALNLSQEIKSLPRNNKTALLRGLLENFYVQTNADKTKSNSLPFLKDDQLVISRNS